MRGAGSALMLKHTPDGVSSSYVVLWNAFKRVGAGYRLTKRPSRSAARQSASTVSPNASHHAEFVDDHPFGVSDWGNSIRSQESREQQRQRVSPDPAPWLR